MPNDYTHKLGLSSMKPNTSGTCQAIRDTGRESWYFPPNHCTRPVKGQPFNVNMKQKCLILPKGSLQEAEFLWQGKPQMIPCKLTIALLRPVSIQNPWALPGFPRNSSESGICPRDLGSVSLQNHPGLGGTKSVRRHLDFGDLYLQRALVKLMPAQNQTDALHGSVIL